MTIEAKKPERLERVVYDGMKYLGLLHSRRSGTGFDAVDADGGIIGHYDATDTAMLAVIFLAKRA